MIFTIEKCQENFKYSGYNVTPMKTKIEIKMKGYEVVEKTAQVGGNSARVYVPKHWKGKKVKVILLEK